MPDDGPRNVRHARKRAVPISTLLNFAPAGLVLGAGTVLLRADSPRRLVGSLRRLGRVNFSGTLLSRPLPNLRVSFFALPAGDEAGSW